MPRFLTEEWFDQVQAAAATDAATPATATPTATATGALQLTLRQVVTGGPDGDVAYAISVDHGTVTVHRSPEGPADATFTEDYDTAAALNRGELSPQEAFMTGRIRVSGNVSVLLASQEALSGLAPVLASVRPSTTY